MDSEEMLEFDPSLCMSGEIPYIIDQKGRMSFPQDFRRIIGDKFILTRGADKRLVVYPQDRWNDFLRRIAAMKDGRNKEVMKQIYVKGATKIECDQNGRMLIPQVLREYASLTKDVLVVGSMDVAEIWDKETYKKYNESVLSGAYEAQEAIGV